MTLFRRGLPRGALVGAILGFVFGLLIAPTGLFWPGIAWSLLALALLFGRSLAYYAYLTWAVLWVAWRGVSAYRGEIPAVAAAIEIGLPLASLLLLSASGYLEAIREPPA